MCQLDQRSDEYSNCKITMTYERKQITEKNGDSNKKLPRTQALPWAFPLCLAIAVKPSRGPSLSWKKLAPGY